MTDQEIIDIVNDTRRRQREAAPTRKTARPKSQNQSKPRVENVPAKMKSISLQTWRGDFFAFC